MAKPTQLPRWASDAGAVITPEPTEGKKGTGWTHAGEKPPFQYMNWWQRRVYEWCAYLDGITNEVLTWAAKQTFGAGASVSVAPTAPNDVVRLADIVQPAYGNVGNTGTVTPGTRSRSGLTVQRMGVGWYHLSASWLTASSVVQVVLTSGAGSPGVGHAVWSYWDPNDNAWNVYAWNEETMAAADLGFTYVALE